MLSHNNLKNKIVFAVAIGFLLAVVQCRPLEESVDKIPEALAAVPVVVPVKEAEIKNVEAVKEALVEEAPKDTTILSVVPEVAVVAKKDDSSAETSKSLDSASAESSENKSTSNESSEEVKVTPVVAAESTVVAEAAVPVPAASVESVVLAAAEPVSEIVKEAIVEPVVAAVASEPAVSVASAEPAVASSIDAVEPVKAVVDAAVEPAVAVAVEPVVVVADEKPASAVAVEAPEAAAIKTRSVDAEENVKPEEVASPAAVVDQKVIIVTPSSTEVLPAVVPAIVPVVEVKVEQVQEDVASVAPNAPVAVTVVADAAPQTKEAPVVTSEA